MEHQDSLTSELTALKSPNSAKGASFLNFLVKAVKAKLVYPSSSKLPLQFKQELAARADEILREMLSLDFKVSSSNILCDGQVIYESTSRTENFAHIFFRDGITGLDFKNGVNVDELGRFVDLLAKVMRTVYIDDDLATLMWEENFEYVDYELIDDGLDIETVEYSLNDFKTGNGLSGEDLHNLLREDGEIALDEGDDVGRDTKTGFKLRGGAYDNMSKEASEFLNHITEITEEEKGRTAEALAEDARFDYVDYVLTVMFEMLGLEKELPGYNEVLDLMGKALDSFISRGLFGGASALLSRMHEMLAVLNNLKSKRADRIQEFLVECSSQERIELVTNSVNTLKDVDMVSLANYLKQLPWMAISPLLGSLGELRDYKARWAVCGALAELGKDRIEILATGLDDERWFVVRNVVMVMGQIQQPRVIHYLKKTIRHPDYRVRKETLATVSRIESPESDDFMILALSDHDPKIQQSSLMYLVDNKSYKAAAALERIINDKKFKNKSPELMRAFIEAYAVLGQDRALDYLKPLATKRLLLPSSKIERVRLFAIRALGMISSSEARKTLKKLSESRNGQIAAAAVRALKNKDE